MTTERGTLERQVTDVILERTATEITIEGYTFEIAPPTLGTIILVSEEAARLPRLDVDTDNPLAEVLAKARHCQGIARIAAILILGAKRIGEGRRVERNATRRGKLAGIFFGKTRPHAANDTDNELDALARAIAEEVSPRTIAKAVNRLLADNQVGDFFGLTASLNAQNRLKATKEAETPSGA